MLHDRPLRLQLRLQRAYAALQLLYLGIARPQRQLRDLLALLDAERAAREHRTHVPHRRARLLAHAHALRAQRPHHLLVQRVGPAPRALAPPRRRRRRRRHHVQERGAERAGAAGRRERAAARLGRRQAAARAVHFGVLALGGRGGRGVAHRRGCRCGREVLLVARHGEVWVHGVGAFEGSWARWRLGAGRPLAAVALWAVRRRG